LTGFGYVPNIAQTPLALLGIRLFFGPIPAMIILVSLPLLIWYPISRKSHEAIRAQLDSQEAAAAEEKRKMALT
jgi:glycoside/pentoside/hexuronide:cation symporter, GPH family